MNKIRFGIIGGGMIGPFHAEAISQLEGVIEGSTAIYPGLPRRLEIHGERGTVIFEGDEIKLWDFVGQEKGRREEEKVRGFKDKKLGDTSSDPTHHSIENHKLQIRDFMEAVKEDREPFVSGLEGRKSLEIIRGIYKSAKNERPVKFPVRE